jgi:thiol-disulfide isomerase/thioredoxin
MIIPGLFLFGCAVVVNPTNYAAEIYVSPTKSEVIIPDGESASEVAEDENGNQAAETTQKESEEGKKDSAKVTLELRSLEEILKEFSKPQAKWTVVDVWSTSCVPCMKEFPQLVALAKKYPDKLRCVSVNVDYLGLKSKPVEGYREKVLGFLSSQNAAFRNYLCTTPDSEVFEKIEIESIPAVMVYSPDGERKMVFTDSNSGDDGVTYQGDVIPWLEKQLK